MSASVDKKSLNIAVLTVSDTRSEATDTSGQFLVESLRAAGHTLAEKAIVIDDIYQLRAIVSRWIADPAVHVILSTGGTGFSGRDSTPEALALMRWCSFLDRQMVARRARRGQHALPQKSSLP